MNRRLIKMAVDARKNYISALDNDRPIDHVRLAGMRVVDAENLLSDDELAEYKKQIKEWRDKE